jgi:hypothetical protein
MTSKSGQELRRIYQPFDPAFGYPAASHIFYECLRCGDISPSRPDRSIYCKCRNLAIDIDYGRVSVEDHSLFKIFTEKP